MFVDDTTLYCVGKDMEGVIDVMDEAAKELFITGVKRIS